MNNDQITWILRKADGGEVYISKNRDTLLKLYVPGDILNSVGQKTRPDERLY